MKKIWGDNGRIRTICILLLAGSVLAAVKCIFVGLQVDEEYAVSMPYRMLLGDRLFAQIWDPHQTSAFVIEFLIWIYRKLFHTTEGVVLWIRLFGTLLHGGISYGVYRMLRHYLSAENSFYLGILYFNLLPKGYVTPEFSNLLVWSVTLLFLSLFCLDRQKKPLAAVTGGIWMCAAVLSYPSAVLLFPFFLLYLWKQEGYGKKSAGIFAGVCLLGGGCYLAYLFSYMSPEELLVNLQYLLLGNSGHTEAGAAGRLKAYLGGFGAAALICMAYAAFACLLMGVLKKSGRTKDWYAAQSGKSKRILFGYLTLAAGVLYQALHWMRMGQEYEYSYIYTIYFVLFGLVCCFAKELEKETGKTVKLWLVGALLLFLAVLLLTDLSIFTSVRYLSPGVVMGLAALLLYSEKEAAGVYRKAARGLLLLWCFTSVFIKGWEYRDNDGRMMNITCVRGIVSEGPAKGLFTQYMQSYMQESTYEEMQRYLEPGDKLLLLDTGGTIAYLFQDVEVASYTTICDPRYNEALLKYWELNHDKYPDVIAVQCWYGELRWDPESWIMQWIENEFETAQVIDGQYFRYYIGK